MSRIQLALNVTDIDAAVAFYSTLFDTEPAKRRPGYANFAIAEPPLKLVLIQHAADRSYGIVGSLSHLGVEVETPEKVEGAYRRLAAAGLVPRVQEATTCCYAVQDKAWVSDPDGAPWEVYTVLADATDATDMGCSVEMCGPSAGQPVNGEIEATEPPTVPVEPTQCC